MSKAKQSSKYASEISQVLKNALKGKQIKESLFEQIEVKEYTKHSILVVAVIAPQSIVKSLRKTAASVIKDIEEVVQGNAFIIRKRVASGLKKGEKAFRTGPTYKDYQEFVAADLVLPAHIVDRRTLVREDGSRVEKIMVDLKHKDELVNRFEPMGILFEEMFEKKAQFQSNYY